MSSRIARAAALMATVSLSLAGTVAAAGAASAEQAVNGDSPAVATLYVGPTPVDPQPLSAGHEGDTLMQVSVAMPARPAVQAKAVKQAKGSKRGR
jgi:hypothetical protein